MRNENTARELAPERPRELASPNEMMSVKQAVVALEQAAGMDREREKLLSQGSARLSAIEQSVDIPEAEIAPSKQKVEHEMQAIAAEALAETRQAQRATLDVIRRWAHKNRNAAMFLVASALAHAPILPQTRAAYDQLVETVKGVTDWERPNMVIRPQTDAERAAVTERIYERGARTDVKATEEYKQAVQEKMERGESVSFKRLYLDMERLGGEDPQEVKEAEEKLDELIARYSKEADGKLDEAFIRREVAERFGSDEDYVWGQASLTKRMTTGKRNCVSFAREQQVVFEGIIAQFPEELRSRYEVGMSLEKKHEIATVTVKRADGTVETTYLLQPPTEKIVGAKDRPGSPTVSLETVKQAIVSKGPIHVTADAKGEKIEKSPDLDVHTDQPVALNLKVDGDLRGSDYVREMAGKQNVKPVIKPPEKKAKVGEWEISPEHLETEHEGPEVVEKIWTNIGVRDIDPVWHRAKLDLSDLRSPKPEAIDRLKPTTAFEDELSKTNTVEVVVGDTSRWSEDSLKRLMRMPHEELRVNIGQDGSISDNLVKALAEDVPDRRFRSLTVVDSGAAETSSRHLPAAQLQELLTNAKGLKRIELEYLGIDTKNPKEELEAFAQAPAIDIYTNFESLSDFDIERLRCSKATFHLSSNAYIKLLDLADGVSILKILDTPNIKPDYPRANIGEASVIYGHIRAHRPNHPLLRHIKYFFKSFPGFSKYEINALFP